MNEKTQGVIETKLDILINDFQRFRDSQEVVNKEIKDHAAEEDEVQAEILTTLKWHKLIGAFMMGVIVLLVIDRIKGGVM